LTEARREVGEAVAACREAESRLAATRADADAVRRMLSEVDSAAAAARGVAEAARAEVGRSREAADQIEGRLDKFRRWLAEARDGFAALDAESRQALEDFRAAVEQLRAAGSGEVPPAPGASEAAEAPPAAELPDVMPLLPGERAEDLRERFVHLLNDAWAVEKEQVGLLQALADECEEPGVRGMLEEDRAACQRRQEEVEGRLAGLGAHPAGGRGLLGQLVTRIWEAVQAPRDPADRGVLALLKAVSAAEFQAGLYAAAHACARAVGGEETAQQFAGYYREERGRADRLRAALAPTVARAAHR
jgi:ferritin-like metal-binding protein YciE